MSICGNCHYNWYSEEECDHDCTFEDAVYREQGAYDRLSEDYEALTEKYNIIYEIANNFSALPITIKEYTKEERQTRNNLPPMMWSPRDWQDYYEQHKDAIESVEKISEALTKVGEVYPISAEETAAALKIASQKITDNSGVSKEILNNDN